VDAVEVNLGHCSSSPEPAAASGASSLPRRAR
jgi:hypothetical protein